jgi:hypothetical protein
MATEQDNTPAMKYVKSLKDAVKRRYAVNYLEWIRGGKKGDVPTRGALSAVLAKAVCLNLDSLN